MFERKTPRSAPSILVSTFALILLSLPIRAADAPPLGRTDYERLLEWRFATAARADPRGRRDLPPRPRHLDARVRHRPPPGADRRSRP